MPNIRKPVVVILTYDHLRTFEFGCAFEVFGLPRPEMGPDWYRCLTAAGEPGRLRGAGGLYLEPAGDLHLLAEADTVIIPGWRGPQDVAPAPMLQALRQAHARGTRNRGDLRRCICARTGRAAVGAACHHPLAAYRRAGGTGPDARIEPDMLYIDEGDILTSAGSAAGLDLCIHLVRKDFGAKAANSVARRLGRCGPS